MSKSRSDLDELKRLQREVAELRGKQEATPSSEGTASGPNSRAEDTREVAPLPVHGSAAREQVPDWERILQDLGLDIEGALKDMEEATRERPALALLAALTIGVVIGLALSRR